MKALQDFRIFVETARLGSLSAVARGMDLTPAAISAAVKRLEADIGTSLFVRSTRSLRLTHHGERFLTQCQQAIALIDDGYAEVQNGYTELSGIIQLTLPSDIGRNVILPWLDEFLDKHPRINLRIHLTDGLADMYSQPVDIALRYGKPKDSNLIALPIFQANYRVLCASPAYISQYGAPISPDDLSNHNCVCFSRNGNPHSRWHFSKGDVAKSVQVSGNRIANDGDAVHKWALSGCGIAYKSLLDITSDLAQGSLVALCTDWQGESVPLNLVCTSRRQLNPSIRALRYFLEQKVNTRLSEASLVFS